MKRLALLILAGALVVVSNAFVLIHAARNRAGEPEAEIELTQRELPLQSRDRENTGVGLRLEWSAPLEMQWFDQAKLVELGFDCSLPPDDPRAARKYARTLSRDAFVALEFDGPAWQRYREAWEKANVNKPTPGSLSQVSELHSRLVAVDASLDAVALRRKYPDRRQVIIVPAVVSLAYSHDRPGKARLFGVIRRVPGIEIHVPVPHSRAFDRQRQTPEPRYKVKLRFGSLYEPWVVGVD